jgi:hypothetical protein
VKLGAQAEACSLLCIRFGGNLNVDDRSLAGAGRSGFNGGNGRGLRDVQRGSFVAKTGPAATWSSVWYLLSAFAVISYTKNWGYVAFAAIGSWIGAYLSVTFLRRSKQVPPSQAVS